MASENRAAAHPVIETLRREPQRFEFFAALRLIECLHPERPRLGTSAKAADDPVRLGQPPDLDFAPASIAYFRERDQGLPHFGNLSEADRQASPAIQEVLDGLPPRLGVWVLGLFGPNGPLPLHLSEYARDRIRERDHTFARFADLFHHRMLCLFYRTWANAQPTVSHDRPDSDRFGTYAASLFGIGAPAFRDRDAMPDAAKLAYAGLLAGATKHPAGLLALLEDFFGLPAKLSEFLGEWMDIPEADRTRLGESPRTGSLGQSAVLGARVWGCQHKFRIILGPMALAQYRDFLPGGRSLAELAAIVRNYVGDELVWDLNLVLRREEVPRLQLGGETRLGWTTWLGTRRRSEGADDLRLDPNVRAGRV